MGSKSISYILSQATQRNMKDKTRSKSMETKRQCNDLIPSFEVGSNDKETVSPYCKTSLASLSQSHAIVRLSLGLK